MSCYGRVLESKRRELLEIAYEAREEFRKRGFRGKAVTVTLRVPNRKEKVVVRGIRNMVTCAANRPHTESRLEAGSNLGETARTLFPKSKGDSPSYLPRGPEKCVLHDGALHGSARMTHLSPQTATTFQQQKAKCCFCGTIKGALIQLHQGLCCLNCFIELLAEKETFTLFKFCQNCHVVLTSDVEQCPVCKNPRVRGSCSQVWLRSRGLVNV